MKLIIETEQYQRYTLSSSRSCYLLDHFSIINFSNSLITKAIISAWFNFLLFFPKYTNNCHTRLNMWKLLSSFYIDPKQRSIRNCRFGICFQEVFIRHTFFFPFAFAQDTSRRFFFSSSESSLLNVVVFRVKLIHVELIWRVKNYPLRGRNFVIFFCW